MSHIQGAPFKTKYKRISERGNPEVLGFPRGNQSSFKIHAVTFKSTQLNLRDLFTQKLFGNPLLVTVSIFLRLKHRKSS